MCSSTYGKKNISNVAARLTPYHLRAQKTMGPTSWRTHVDICFSKEGGPRTSRGIPLKGPDILSLRSFYPIFPVPQDLSREVNLDVTHSEGLKMDDKGDGFAPDVLILPSKLKHFTKVRSDHHTNAESSSPIPDTGRPPYNGSQPFVPQQRHILDSRCRREGRWQYYGQGPAAS